MFYISPQRKPLQNHGKDVLFHLNCSFHHHDVQISVFSLFLVDAVRFEAKVEDEVIMI